MIKWSFPWPPIPPLGDRMILERPLIFLKITHFCWQYTARDVIQMVFNDTTLMTLIPVCNTSTRVIYLIYNCFKTSVLNYLLDYVFSSIYIIICFASHYLFYLAFASIRRSLLQQLVACYFFQGCSTHSEAIPAFILPQTCLHSYCSCISSLVSLSW